MAGHKERMQKALERKPLVKAMKESVVALEMQDAVKKKK